MIELGVADNETRHAVALSDRVVVVLDENATTGYVWHLDVDDGIVRVVDDEPEPGGPMRGAPGQRRFTLEFVRAGSTRVCARKARSWEPERVVETFEVELDVT